jgi:uncharacterized UPF0160 family protein
MSTKILDIIRDAKENTIVTLVTHAGKFHADDVMSTAILVLLLEKCGIKNIRRVRTFNPTEAGYTDDTPNCIVYDIGLGQYDHHQTGDAAKHCVRLDDDGVERKYAACGLIWKEIGAQLVGGEKYANIIYNSIIRQIDDQDNGFGQNAFSTMISHMNPNMINASQKYYDFDFDNALSVAKKMFLATLDHFKFTKEFEDSLKIYVEQSDGSCLVTPTYMPGADDICRERNIPFYVYPNQRKEGSYCFKTINADPQDNNSHLCDIPDEVRNWEGVNFLHPSCFLGAADTKERAIEICRILVDRN